MLAAFTPQPNPGRRSLQLAERWPQIGPATVAAHARIVIEWEHASIQKGDEMDAQALIIWLIVGGVAGWLAGMVVKGGGYGLIGDIIVGIIGGLIAGWLLPQIGIVIGGGIIGAIINAFIGAVILLFILRLVRRAT